jgi:hypothetical protein
MLLAIAYKQGRRSAQKKMDLTARTWAPQETLSATHLVKLLALN